MDIFSYAVNDFSVQYTSSTEKMSYWSLDFYSPAELIQFYKSLPDSKPELPSVVIWRIDRPDYSCIIGGLIPENESIADRENQVKKICLGKLHSGKTVEDRMFYFLRNVNFPIDSKHLLFMTNKNLLKISNTITQQLLNLTSYHLKSLEFPKDWQETLKKILLPVTGQSYLLFYFLGKEIMGIELLTGILGTINHAECEKKWQESILPEIFSPNRFDQKAIDKLVYKKPISPKRMEFSLFENFINEYQHGNK